MIEVKKHGDLVRHKYITGCKKCGCEFYFTDVDYTGINGKGVLIACPECGHMWAGKYIGDIAWSGVCVREENE